MFLYADCQIFERVAFNVGTVIAEDTANKPKTTNTLTNPVVNTMANATKALQNIPISISRFSPIFLLKDQSKSLVLQSKYLLEPSK